MTSLDTGLVIAIDGDPPSTRTTTTTAHRLKDTEIDEEDRVILLSSDLFPVEKQLFFADDPDVTLILVHHQAVVSLHSQILGIHSAFLKELLGQCVYKGMHIIILAKVPDDTLAKIDLSYILAVFQSMYNYSVFQTLSGNYTFGSWRSILRLNQFLDLKVLGSQFRKQFMDALNQYPEGPFKGKDVSATDFVVGGFPDLPAGTHIKKVYTIMNDCKDWTNNKQVHNSLCGLFPSFECWIHFQQWAISSMVHILENNNKLYDLIFEEKKARNTMVYLNKLETFCNTFSHNTLFNWFYCHKTTCPYCIEQSTGSNKRKADTEITKEEEKRSQ
jgi:hypothetical protein